MKEIEKFNGKNIDKFIAIVKRIDPKPFMSEHRGRCESLLVHELVRFVGEAPEFHKDGGWLAGQEQALYSASEFSKKAMIFEIANEEEDRYGERIARGDRAISYWTGLPIGFVRSLTGTDNSKFDYSSSFYDKKLTDVGIEDIVTKLEQGKKIFSWRM